MTGAFDAVFAVFVLAIVVLGVVAVRWARRSDWATRQARGASQGPGRPPADAGPGRP
ncbi:MAG: hypothetical protein ACYDD6_04940 [Acidimicrobiales bacterium]